jgi:hypothetical protein
MRWILLTFSLALGLVSQAQAQNVGADCNAFAAVVMAQQQQANTLHCGFSSWTRTLPYHVQWCQRVSPQQRIDQVTARDRALQQCRAKNAQCQDYATQAIADQDRNIAEECGIGVGNPQWHTDRDRHVAWCMAVDIHQRNELTQARAAALQANCQAQPTPDTAYVGCFADTASRDLAGHTFRSDQMTIEACTRQCREEGYAYAGLQFSSHCFCGNQYGQHGRAPEAECSMPCSGDNSQTCGGAWRNSIYEAR